jgi:hypothetical protein
MASAITVLLDGVAAGMLLFVCITLPLVSESGSGIPGEFWGL